MKHLMFLILVLGLLAFVGHVTVVERHERWRDAPPRHGHWVHPEAKTKKAHKPPKAKRAPEPPRPPAPPEPPRPEDAAAPWEELKIRTITGRVSATEERARADARRQLEDEVSKWLEPEIPASWRPEPRRIDAMIVGVTITPTEKPYGTVYTAEIDADFSDSRRAVLLDDYGRLVVRDRMFKLGGLFVFVLICLAAVSAYIRADEATKGYHTTRLRLLATAAVVAAGYLIYLLLVSKGFQ